MGLKEGKKEAPLKAKGTRGVMMSLTTSSQRALKIR